MNDIEFFGPQLALLVAAGVLILTDIFLPFVGRSAYAGRRPVFAMIALAGVAASLLWSLALALGDDRGEAFDGMMALDDFTLFFNFLFAGVAGVIVLGSIDYLEKHRFQAEYLALVLASTAGMSLMAAGIDLIAIFVALELQAIALFALVGIQKDERSGEAALKFLLVSAISTALTLYGMAYLFGISGETSLEGIAGFVANAGDDHRSALILAAVLLTAGLGFKMAVVPFQMWVPDVYQGAPTPITAFLSVGSKAAGFVVLMRVLQPFLAVPGVSEKVVSFLVIIAVLTLIYGNLAAMPQSNLKRLLAYSSIAHAGYLLIAAASVGAHSAGLAIAFYLVAYLLMTLLSFLVMIVVARQSGGDDLRHFNGLNERSPFLAFAMLVAMLSLAGVPLTAGFFGKFLVFEAAMQEQHYVLVAIGVITVAAGFYYYLKVVRAMYWQQAFEKARITVAPVTKATIVALTVLTFFLGVYPQPVLNMLRGSAAQSLAATER